MQLTLQSSRQRIKTGRKKTFLCCLVLTCFVFLTGSVRGELRSVLCYWFNNQKFSVCVIIHLFCFDHLSNFSCCFPPGYIIWHATTRVFIKVFGAHEYTRSWCLFKWDFHTFHSCAASSKRTTAALGSSRHSKIIYSKQWHNVGGEVESRQSKMLN